MRFGIKYAEKSIVCMDQQGSSCANNYHESRIYNQLIVCDVLIINAYCYCMYDV